ncbi:MAG: hypothetical protein HY084_09660 [Gemmatimonadetes bacterium]|nr:hypothetical protein [Gemmatimonadota bacterium]
MSAFAAVVGRRDGEALPRTLRAMAATWGAEAPHGLAQRCFGADAAVLPLELSEGAPRAAAAGLAHGLLVARDGATLGPHALGDRLWLAGDIRLDAQGALTQALRDAGAALRGDECDDQLVLQAYAAWGDACVARLIGDFSFALWDGERRTLLCARDGAGVRPLYFADLGDAFVCSNVLAAVRAHPGVSASLHEPAIVSFLQWGFNVDAARTTFADVRRLPAARQFLVSASRGVHQECTHWTYPDPPPLHYADDRQYVERFREVLGEAVRDRLRVSRVAIQLSGGLDSPSIAATARRVAPGVALEAFTFRLPPEIAYDEPRLAAEVAHRLGVAYHEADGWGEPLAYSDEPGLVLPEPIDEPEFAVTRDGAAQMAACSPVLLNGEDGDALLSPPGLLRMLRMWSVSQVARRAARYTWAHRRFPHTGLWVRRRLRDLLHDPLPGVPSVVRADAARRSGDQHPIAAANHRTHPEAHADLAGGAWLPVLERSRPAWTGASQETAWPLLDARLIAFVWSIPPIPWCQRKEMLRVAFRGELPDEVLRRPKTPVRGDAAFVSDALRRRVRRMPVRLTAATGQFIDADAFLDMLSVCRTDDLPMLVRVAQLDWWLRRWT